MKVAFSLRALRQLEDIHAYISERNPRAAEDVIGRIRDLCERLGEFPGLGTETDQPGVWRLAVVRYPYNIFDLILPESDEVRILRIRHGARHPLSLSDEELKG